MKKLFFITTIFLLMSPLVVAAQTQITINSSYCTSCNLGYTPLEPIPGVTTNSTGGAISFPQLLANIFSIGITIGALLAVLMLTVGGIQYMVSEAVPNKMGGLRRAQNALWGILLISMSWLILHTVNPQLLTFTLNPCPSGSGGCSVNTGASNTNTNAGTAAVGSNCSSSASCTAGSYCAQESDAYGNQSSVCLPNSNSAAANCASGVSGGGGTLTTYVTGQTYCWLTNETNSTSCSQAGGTWTNYYSFNPSSYYCQLNS